MSRESDCKFVIGKKAKEEAEQNKNEEIEIELEDEYETIKTSGGRTFRSRPRPPGEEPEAELEEEPEEINFDEEIEIGELRGLEEDDRIRVVKMKIVIFVKLRNCDCEKFHIFFCFATLMTGSSLLHQKKNQLLKLRVKRMKMKHQKVMDLTARLQKPFKESKLNSNLLLRIVSF